MRRLYVVTLGCSKNLVDSERLMAMMGQNGYAVVHNRDEPPTSNDVVVVNTCGFIGDAKEESVNTILGYGQMRGMGKLKGLYVMGCLAERYRKDLLDEIPEVDGWYGKFDWTKLVEDLTQSSNTTPTEARHVTTGPANAYVKISEGCNRHCAFCAIPLITGRFHSRPMEAVEAEVRSLLEKGITEFNIIAQDLSSYGLDIYGEMRLPQLVERLARIKGVKWLRLHYAYPAQFPTELLDVMARHHNVCKYLDIALQHISDNVLRNMRRHINGKETRALLAEMRRKVPGIHIRTTLMVGFPGETEEDYEELLEFVRAERFERMGAFAYCEEEGTPAARDLTDNVPEEVKQERLRRLMELQEEISLEIQQEKIGQNLEVVIDREEDDYYIGRTQWDSPEVDPEVLVSKTKHLRPGNYVPVVVRQAMPFELIAEPV